MKSLGLTFVTFGLIGALIGLGISLVHRAQTSNLKAVQLESMSRMQYSATPSDAASNAIAAKDKANGAVINAFLILSRTPPQVDIKSVADLRYD